MACFLDQHCMDRKSVEEKEIIAKLRKHWPGFPKGKLVKSESPDFILRLNRRKSIGIEITRMDDFRHEDSESLLILQKQILSTISRKEGKLPLYYKKVLDAYWLIITVNFGDDNALNRIPDLTDFSEIATRFHKVLVIFMSQTNILELK